MSGTVRVGDVRTFDAGPWDLRSDCKACALKVLEEAAEAVEAWKAWDHAMGTSEALASELADVVQAACNLAAACGINLRVALDACEERNRARGRIADE